mmetsp:Transcript_18339/g.27816  ORF Transcript_18339/g.27816 Transcript_18339/m.27816 type:complete len:150 (-) Transcript_18339:1058-1507(-)
MESISKSEKKEQKSTDTFETLNLADVFPSGKVKKQLLANKNVGKLRKDSVELIECASARFLQRLIQSTSENTVTLDRIKQATEPYDFIDLKHLEEEKVPKMRKVKGKSNRKRPSTNGHGDSVKEAASHLASLQSRIPEVKVIEDEDDYD